MPKLLHDHGVDLPNAPEAERKGHLPLDPRLVDQPLCFAYTYEAVALTKS